MAKKPIKETIHAKGLDISIYTNDFENEYVSLTDIAKYRSTDPRITIHNWLRSRDIVVFLGRVLYQEVERRAWRYWNLNKVWQIRWWNLRTYGYCTRIRIMDIPGI